MPNVVHIFIGKEFTKLVEGIGRATLRYGGSTTASDIAYICAECSGKSLSLSRLVVKSTTKDNVLCGQDRYINTEWHTPESAQAGVSLDTFGSVWNNLFDELITAEEGDIATNLTVTLHFPLYKADAYKVFEAMYVGISSVNKPTRLVFMGYCDDIAKILEPGYKITSPSRKQIDSYAKFRDEQNIGHSSNLIVMQNTTFNGITLGLNFDDLKEVVAQFVLASRSYYSELFPPTLDYKDVVSFGISSLQVDKYLLVNYLMNRTMLNAMDAVSVNNKAVDINLAATVVDNLLKYKQTLLSDVFKSGINDNAEVLKTFASEVDQIIKACNDIFKRDKSITSKAAILAAMLSKTDCPLFSDSIYNDSSISLRDLFSEALDYFIENDLGDYLRYNDEPLSNPIKELKELDNKIINSETEVRRLEEELKSLEGQIIESEQAKKYYVDEDGIFHFDNKEIRLLPFLEQTLLDDTYEPKEGLFVPDSADLRSHFRPIQDQGSQGSCTAFAVTAAFEYLFNIQNSQLLDLSEAFTYYVARDFDEANDVSVTEDSGSRINVAIKALGKYGLATEEKCRYKDTDCTTPPSEAAYKDAETRKVKSAFNVKPDRDSVKAALAEGYPVVGSFTLYDSFFENASKDGYFPMPSQDEIALGANDASGIAGADANKHHYHAMTIVGYSDKLQRFIVRNSWGDDWGDAGYCYMPYAYVENSALCNCVSIITELETTQSEEKKPLPVIKPLSIDNGDVKIRYYICQALADKEKEDLKRYYQDRTNLLIYFEQIINSLASMPSHRDGYIQAALNTLTEEDEALVAERKEIEEKLEVEAKALKRSNLITIICVACTIALPLILIWVLNGFVLPLFNASESDSISVWWSLLVILPVGGVLIYKTSQRWNEWREYSHKLNLRLKSIQKRRAEIKACMGSFKFKTFAAWHLLRELSRLQSHFNTLYSKYLSLINNLRVWYEMIKKSDEDVDLKMSVPNISLLNQELVDKFFNDTLSKDGLCEIDFTERLDQYSISDEYFAEYKTQFVNGVATKILQHPAVAGFNITDHIIESEESSWVTHVDRPIATRCSRLSDIFIHLSSITSPDMQRSEYMITYGASRNEIKLRKKFLNSFQAFDGTNPYMLTYISIATLNFDDCEVFYSPKSK